MTYRRFTGHNRVVLTGESKMQWQEQPHFYMDFSVNPKVSVKKKNLKKSRQTSRLFLLPAEVVSSQSLFIRQQGEFPLVLFWNLSKGLQWGHQPFSQSPHQLWDWALVPVAETKVEGTASCHLPWRWAAAERRSVVFSHLNCNKLLHCEPVGSSFHPSQVP